MRTAGIIGGLGPSTTAKFYLEIISMCYERTKEQRPPILIWNVPSNYKIEEDLLVRSVGEEKYIPYLVEGAEILERAGADFLIIPCNTVHIFIEDVRKAVSIPVLSILEEAAGYLNERDVKEVGILASTKTLEQNLYGKVLAGYGIREIPPEDSEQEKMGKIIVNIVLNRHRDKDKKELVSIVNNFEKRGIKHVILACTDLQHLVKQEDANISIHDTMKILSEATVREILKG